ncbi:MAG: hypothetical protein ABIK85_04330, partial [Candidatus Eisenbacteria bacterium]
DCRPVVQVYMDVDDEFGPFTVEASVADAAGAVVETFAPKVRRPGCVRFRPSSPLAKGDYTVTVHLMPVGQGAPATHAFTFTVTSME